MTTADTADSAPITPALPLARAGRSLAGYLFMPSFLASVCLAMYLYVGAQDLDSIESRSLNAGSLANAVWKHLQLVAASTVLVIAIAVPLGVLLTRPFARRARPFLLTAANLGQAVPSLGILVLLAVAFLFLGFKAAVLGLVLSTILPILLNTMVGLDQVDESILEAARGMGISKFGVLRQIELPLSVPIILAGVRTALVINVGTAIIATYINSGGLGDIIVAGLANNRTLVQTVGAVLTAVLALFIDYLAGIAEDLLRPKGV